jgi:4-aminobutyrate aminotransferase / (S)-3-amino-2-methylpropionate transaminase / 5-aminovalerate transaminase
MSVINLVTELPGPRSREIVARREAAISRGVGKLTPIAVQRASGAVVTDVDGNTLIDFAGGIGMFAVGHNFPPVVDAIKAQVDDLVHMCAIVRDRKSVV